MHVCREERFLSARILIKSNSGTGKAGPRSKYSVAGSSAMWVRNLYYDTGRHTGRVRQPSRKRCIFIRGGS